MNDARERRVALQAGDPDVERAAAVDGAREHFVARPLVDRQRLAGHRRLIHGAHPGHDFAIERELLAGLDDDDGAWRHDDRPPRIRSPAASRTSTSVGVSAISERTAVRARSSVRASSACAKANRNTTAAPSDHWPIAIAPTTADEHQHVDVERTEAAAIARPSGP